ncbi:sugar ABC transporter permease [Dickeya chrysanthemi]|uniref:carbohydrate ABC transporter permease n=1 Tax=Dickeya chrysanthemi TaxID=556 RepID=UPI0025A256A6|nr:sugar ABC transporter permease [Dickeya chrysanthemi]WJM86972.1 sugar ABC transporter permease [Dickeya chrysanthemi]
MTVNKKPTRVNHGRFWGMRLIRVGFIAPLLIPLWLFWVIPFFCSLYISFTDWDYISPDYHLVGMDNYRDVLHSDDFAGALGHTLVFAVAVVIPVVVLGLGFALLLHRQCRGQRGYQAMIFSPWITPTVAVSVVWSWVFDSRAGLANQLLGLFGYAGVPWLEQPGSAMLAVVTVTIWQGIGWTMMLFITALNRIPADLYDAARLDGGSRARRLLTITLPLISPTTFFLLLVNLVNAVQAFDQFQMLTQGGPGNSTRTLMYLFYQQAFQQFSMGPAAATAVMILLLAGSLSLVNTLVARRWVYF